MKLGQIVRPVALAAGIALASAGVVHAQADRAALAALKMVERGQWQLREGGPSGTAQKICVRDPNALLQIRHGNAQCSHFVVENSARTATIQYECPGRGHGRTTVSVETPRLLRVQTQGVLDGAPFVSELEGRRMGVCN